MKGKHLFNIFSALNSKDRKKISLELNFISDKRVQLARELLRLPCDKEEKFNSGIEKIISRHLNHLPDSERDRYMRRVIDFTKKLVENSLAANFLSENVALRDFILMENLFGRNNLPAFLHYATKIQSYGNAIPYLQSMTFERIARQMSRVQNDNEVEEIKRLMRINFQMNDDLYFDNQAYGLNVMSSLYFDDISIFSGPEFQKPTDTFMLSAIERAPKPETRILLRLAFARFHFSDKMLTSSQFRKIEDELKKTIPSRKHFLKRAYLFARMTLGWHQGKESQSLLNLSQQLYSLIEQLKIPDTIGVFYYLLFLTIEGKEKELDKVLEYVSGKYFLNENIIHLEFIQCLRAFMNEDWQRSLEIVSPLVYSDNYYISLWSRIIEFASHFMLGNFSLCESLLNRMKVFLLSHRNKSFLYNSNYESVKIYKKLLKLKSRKTSIDLSVLDCFNVAVIRKLTMPEKF